MNIRRRLEALRNALKKAKVRFKGSCSTCGRRAGQGRAWAWTRPFDPDAVKPSKPRSCSCATCGQLVDAGGAALGLLGSDGEVHFKLFGWGDPLADSEGRVILEPKKKMGARKNGREP